ncbi:MAG: DUF1822 family protein [Cyanobacteria bacterium RM1_2_2]|nr:DUF1822 family protein [Cyanobacteria bacterium RM1_2_2]
MANMSSSLINSRLLPPETIWLEPEQIEQAQAMSECTAPEAHQWQSYLNALALLSFEQWLSERLPEYSIERLEKSIESVCYIEVNGFKFCLIAVEQVLDETVQIHRAVVEPEQAAHFYVVQEVSEEQELVMIRGFLRFDELIHYRNHYLDQMQNDSYPLPLSLLDAEPNHLLFYCRALQPTAFALRAEPFPSPISPLPTEGFLVALTQTTTKLTQWLQDTVDESWQTIDQFINPEANLAFSTRSIEAGVRRGKLINLGVQFGQQTVALLVNVTSETEGKLGVLVQLYSTGEARYLIPNLKLSLRSSTNQVVQEVTSRSQDNYIQLKPFKGRPGTRFSVAIHLGSETVEENFEL